MYSVGLIDMLHPLNLQQGERQTMESKEHLLITESQRMHQDSDVLFADSYRTTGELPRCDGLFHSFLDRSRYSYEIIRIAPFH